MAEQRLLTFPLCGFGFVREDSLCRHGCPLGSTCHLARCPACEYEFPERQPDRPWLARLFGRKGGPPVAAQDALTVRELSSGECAQVISLGGEHPGRRHHRAVFGLVPGAEVRLVQRYPSYVVEIGETTLALDADVAADIVVARS